MFIYKTARHCKTYVLIPLWALLWKYLKTRLYQYCYSFWETFVGVMPFLILFLTYQINIDFPEKILRIMESQISQTRVFFSPFNNFTQRLMSRVEACLNNDSGILPKQKWEFESIGFPMKFHADFFNTSNGIAEVRFKNNDPFPQDLEYALYVISDEAKNNLKQAYNGLLRSIIPKEEIAPSFLGPLQWAIDKSFIEELVHGNISQKLMMSTVPNFLREELLVLHKFIILCTIIGPLPFYLVYSTNLIVERRSGMKELLTHWGIYYGVLRFSHIIESVLVGIFYSIPVAIVLKMSWESLLPHSNIFVITLTLLFHFVNSMAFALITTALSQDFHYADCLGVVFYLSTFILDFLWHNYTKYTFLLCWILPHVPIHFFWNEVLYLERVGMGTQFSNIGKCHSGEFSVITVWIFSIIQLIVTTTIAWYLDLVRPGTFGVPRKWDFIFKKKYWFRGHTPTVLQPPPDIREDTNFEKGPKGAEIAVQIVNVSKVYKLHESQTDVTALDSVTFNCYKGEITVLLGGDSSGKSTLMNIITGIVTATKGNVFVDGYDIADEFIEYRHTMGVCMQRNICFKALTVCEHIKFFKKLKGKGKEGFTVEQLMKKLKLYDIADNYDEQLTNQNLRSLQVACVLAGDADVLVLDEPTTGMDIDLKHRLWDLLMLLRGKKTIIMTTPCLQEANVLGDRIAILDNGTLKCYGSPAFLKNVTGTSFSLLVAVQDEDHLNDVKAIVESIIPEIEYRIHNNIHITFLLPTIEFRNFPRLFEALEEKKIYLGINLINVGMSMEEVLLKFLDTKEVKDELNESKQPREGTDEIIQLPAGCKLAYLQIKMLIGRMFTYLMMKKTKFIVLRMIVPLLCILIITLTTNYSLRHNKMFSHYSAIDDTEIIKLLYNAGSYKRTGLLNALNQYPEVKPVFAVDIDREFKAPSPGHSNKKTVGLKITDRYTKIFHPNDPRVTSKSINMFSNIYLSTFVPHLNSTIRTTYESLPKPRNVEFKDVKPAFFCLKWSCWVTFFCILPLAPIVMLCIVELNCGIRDNHMMAGCTPMVFWTAKLLAHKIIFFAVVNPIMLVCLNLDFDNTFNQIYFCCSVVAMLFMFGLAFQAQMYLQSFFCRVNDAISQTYIVSLFFGLLLPILLAVLDRVKYLSIIVTVPYYILLVVGRISPMFALGVGLARLTLRARLNGYCSLNKHLCPELEFDDEAFDAKVCCESKSLEPFPYLVSHLTGLYDLINLFGQFIVFWVLVLLLEYRIPQYLFEQISNWSYKEPVQQFKDMSVIKEKNNVRQAIYNKRYEDNILLVDNVHKGFRADFMGTQHLNPVRGITFAMKQGECLAILGPQTSGKTSLLNMLAGTLTMTRGYSCINRTHIRGTRMEYIHRISLSSSDIGMDSFLTGRQNLTFLAELKGYPQNVAYEMACNALRCMGLVTNGPPVSKYSRGCLHRLSLCGTLVLSPSVAFLDAPLSNIDAGSKLLVVKVLQQLLSKQTTLLVAESSMDWRLLQPVLTRIAIMSKGQFAAIGPAKEIVDSVAKGYTARIKLKIYTAYKTDKLQPNIVSSNSSSSLEPDEEDNRKKKVFVQSITDLKTDFLKIFNTSRLCREHVSMLYYRIEDDKQLLLLSEMFQKLQDLKEKYDEIIDDYYLSSTTIEDVFWLGENEMDPAIVTRHKSVI